MIMTLVQTSTNCQNGIQDGHQKAQELEMYGQCPRSIEFLCTKRVEGGKNLAPLSEKIVLFFYYLFDLYKIPNSFKSDHT